VSEAQMKYPYYGWNTRADRPGSARSTCPF
jgi:hypothetical protein